MRPTPDRVRETLFNWLRPHLNAMRVLDLFAGSGALGFEALSNGAAHATLVERDRKVARSIIASRDLLSANASVETVDAFRFLDRCAPLDLDLIFLDPPFSDTNYDELVVRTLPHLAPSGFIYVEADREMSFDALDVHRRSRAASVHFALFHRRS